MPWDAGGAWEGVGGGSGAVDSVNAQTGVVVLDASDVGADATGTASGALASHVAAGDPHTQYALESALGNAATKNVGTGAGSVAAGDDSRITGAEQTTAKNANSGYAGLDSAGKLATARFLAALAALNILTPATNTLAYFTSSTVATLITLQSFMVTFLGAASTAVARSTLGVGVQVQVTAGAPSVTDDTAAGYAVGSEWFDTTGKKHYTCTDATNGAAVWRADSGKVTVFTASGTWTPIAGLIQATIVAIGAGGGGASGRRGAAGTVRGGGGGAAGGGWTIQIVPAALVGASETVTIGAGGAGGAAVSADDTNGSNGTTGGGTTVGSLARASGGANGAAGTTSGGAGGTANQGGGSGGQGGTTTTATSGTRADRGGSGGGGGSGISSGNSTANGGAGAGQSQQAASSSTAAGGTPGNAGTAGNAGPASTATGGGGGGGGGSSTSGAAGAGGAGALYGGGGGGGGASVNATGNSGAGGAGAAGIVVIWEI
jgi:hypothetical protein